MYLLVRAAYGFFGLFSMPALQRTGRILGTIAYYILPSRRKAAEINCGIIGIDKNVKNVVKSSFRHTFSAYFESFYAKNINDRFLSEMVDVEYLGGKKPSGSRYFMVSAHFGGWELSPYVMTKKLGLKGAAVARKIKDEKLDQFIMRQRINSEVEYIHHRGAGEKITEYIEKGLTVGVLLDHSSMLKDSMFVPLFGLNTTFMKGIPLLSVRHNYPVLPVFVLRKETGFRLLVYPEIHPDKSLKAKARTYDVAEKINKVYEDVIKKHPDQWYLIHKRFKRLADSDGNYIKDSSVYK